MEKRTDLALEIRESFPEDEIEVKGVALQEKEYLEGRLRVTTVKIKNQQGQRQMNKPIGNYITLEFTSKNKWDSPDRQEKTRNRAALKLAKLLERMSPKEGVYLVAGLGNRFATPDALGPFVLDDVEVNRHVSVETPWEEPGSKKVLCALSPGVMGQTGMESQEILGGIIDKVHPCCLLVVDSLATRSIRRLCNTIQITDTGICPGAGIGNNRNELSREKLNIPVIAIGVPTVVDAGTIVSECMEETLLKEGYTMEQIFAGPLQTFHGKPFCHAEGH
jgi:spore protease